MLRLGDYELEGLIGRGSMGLVYRARPQGGGQVVALKRIRWVGEDHVIKLLQSEASAIVGLDHPNILKVVEVIADGEGLAIAMHLAEGGSLSDLLGRSGRLPPEDGAAVAVKVADALAAVHSLGIVHADIKPSNILLEGVDKPLAAPLLSDFGLSRWIGLASPSGGAVLGTAEYLDPAVARGASPSAASDLYSLGIVCYEILAGRLPYRGVTPLATLRASDRGGAEPLAQATPTVPVGLAAVVERAMSRQPQERPATAGEVADALRAEIAGRCPAVLMSGRVVPTGDGPTEDGSGATEPRRIRPRRRSGQPWPEVPAPARRSSALAVAASVATVLAVLVMIWVVGRGSGAHATGDPCGARTSTASQQARPATGAVTVLADVAGDGCLVPVTWSSGVITVSLTSGRPPVRFALGQPGDELLLGDWDCRRGSRPALYRPATGQVFYFAAWAEPGRDLPPSHDDSTSIVNGVPRVARDGIRGCDRVEVALPGDPTPVSGAPPGERMGYP